MLLCIWVVLKPFFATWNCNQGAVHLDTALRTAKAAEQKDPTDDLTPGLYGAAMTPVVGGVADLANIVIDACQMELVHQRIIGSKAVP